MYVCLRPARRWCRARWCPSWSRAACRRGRPRTTTRPGRGSRRTRITPDPHRRRDDPDRRRGTAVAGEPGPPGEPGTGHARPERRERRHGRIDPGRGRACRPDQRFHARVPIRAQGAERVADPGGPAVCCVVDRAGNDRDRPPARPCQGRVDARVGEPARERDDRGARVERAVVGDRQPVDKRVARVVEANGVPLGGRRARVDGEDEADVPRPLRAEDRDQAPVRVAIPLGAVRGVEVAVRLGRAGAVPASVPRSPVLVHVGAEGEEQRHAEGSGGVGPGRQLPVEVTRGDPFERVPPFGAARAPAGHVGGGRRQERDIRHGAVAPDRQHPLPREGQAAEPGLRERDPGEPAPGALLEGRELGARRDRMRRGRRPTRAGEPGRTWQPTPPERARRSRPRARRMPPARRR